MTPVIYADILFLYNFLMNSIILAITARIINARINIMKIALGAVLGGIYSVFMFFPAVEMLYTFILKFFIFFGIFYLVFGGNSIHKVVREFAVFSAVNFVLGGAVFAVVFLTDFGVMVGSVVSGTEVYMNLSPLILVSATGITYMVLVLNYKAQQKAVYERGLIKRMKIEHKGKSVEVNVFLDTGCRVYDPVNGNPVALAELRFLKILLDDETVGVIENGGSVDEAYACGLRVLPLSTINGESVVFGIVADLVCVEDFVIKGLTIGLLNSRIDEKYNGIINPEILMGNVFEEEGIL